VQDRGEKLFLGGVGCTAMRCRLSNASECCVMCSRRVAFISDPFLRPLYFSPHSAHFHHHPPSLLRQRKSANQPQLPLTDASILLWLCVRLVTGRMACVLVCAGVSWCVLVCARTSLCDCLQILLFPSVYVCVRLTLTLFVLQADRFSLRQH